jgi:hypothetical protein
MLRFASRVTAATLAGIAALHLGWACGSSFPFSTRTALADSVVGAQEVPTPQACAGVAASLLAAAALIGGKPSLPPRLRKVGIVGVTAALGGRAALGFLGRTDPVSPGSTSERFRVLDRRLFSPLCAALAVGSAAALVDG